jgi:hypothetical protein
MNSMNDQRFFDLAMKVIARQATDAEHAELEQLLASDPELRAEYERLRADVRVAKEALPLVEATQAGADAFPAYARERLQTKVWQTLGQPAAEAPSVRRFTSGWRWALGLAATAVLVLLFALRPTSSEIVIQIAMLDAAGGTRGSATNEVAALQQVWPAASVQSFDNAAELSGWEKQLPTNSAESFAKIIYDRTAGEVRVIGRAGATRFERSFPVDTDLATTLRKADEFVRQQSSPVQ